MTKDELFDHLEGSTFEWAEYEHDGQEGLLIRCSCPRCRGCEEKTHVAFDALDDLTWEAVKRHVINGRHIKHLTRIVGYYSEISNWNQSKKGELKDRQSGNYSVEQSA